MAAQLVGGLTQGGEPGGHLLELRLRVPQLRFLRLAQGYGSRRVGGSQRAVGDGSERAVGASGRRHRCAGADHCGGVLAAEQPVEAVVGRALGRHREPFLRLLPQRAAGVRASFTRQRRWRFLQRGLAGMASAGGHFTGRPAFGGGAWRAGTCLAIGRRLRRVLRLEPRRSAPHAALALQRRVRQHRLGLVALRQSAAQLGLETRFGGRIHPQDALVLRTRLRVAPFLVVGARQAHLRVGYQRALGMILHEGTQGGARRLEVARVEPRLGSAKHRLHVELAVGVGHRQLAEGLGGGHPSPCRSAASPL